MTGATVGHPGHGLHIRCRRRNGHGHYNSNQQQLTPSSSRRATQKRDCGEWLSISRTRQTLDRRRRTCWQRAETRRLPSSTYPTHDRRQSLAYFQAAAGFPTKQTFLDAVRTGNYATWPGLTTTLIAKHFPDSDETQKGHMKGQRKGIRSTKPKPTAVQIKIEPGTKHAPHPPAPTTKLSDIFTKTYKLTETIHTDQTGAFPVTSQRGYRYIMVGIHLDANYIFCETMKNRTEGEMIGAYQNMVNRMQAAGLRLKHHRLDNECSANFKACIHEN